MAELGNAKDGAKLSAGDMTAPLVNGKSVVTNSTQEPRSLDVSHSQGSCSSSVPPPAGAAHSSPRASPQHSPSGSSPSAASWCQRALGPMTVHGIRHSSLTLTSTALGGGVLAVSYVFQLCGLVVGLSLLVISAVLAYLSIDKLMRMAVDTETDSYAALFSHCAGPRAGPILDVLLFIFGNGTCVGYLVFISDFIPEVFSDLAPDFFLVHRSWAIVVAACLCGPLIIQRDTSILSYIAPASIIALMYMAVVVTAQVPHLFTENLGKKGFGKIQLISPDCLANLPEAFSICLFSFNCHLNVIPVANNMIQPTKIRIKSISCKVNSLQATFYIIVGLAGYLSFLGATPGNLLAAYDATNVVIVIARIVLTVTMLIAIPMNLVPCVRSGLQLVDYFKGEHVAAETRPAAPRIILTLVCCVVQVGLAIKVPGVADVISLLGATVATAMMMTIPAYCSGVAMEKTRKNQVIRVVLYGLSVLAVSSVPIKILRQTKVMS